VPSGFDRPELARYRLEEEVGSGGMSVVYAAHDVELDRRVALKVMRRDVGHHNDQARLLDEARALAGLNHANIVPVYHVGHAKDGRLYMSMELVQGKNLRMWLDMKPRTYAEVLEVLMAAGRGLAAAHAVDLVHCDFKPTNILVGDDGRVRVVDFGIARRVFLSETLSIHTISGEWETGAKPEKPQVIGTPRYMSPEQARAEALDPKTDQFSFCLTLYESLYGQLPFLGTSNRQRLRNILAGNIRPAPRGSLVPRRVHAVVVRGLHRDPDARWPDMNALLRALDRALRQRRRYGAVALGVAGVTAVVGTALLPSKPPCASTRDEVDAVWTAARRDRIQDAFETSGLPNARDQHQHIDRRLEGFADGWAAARMRVCEDDTLPAERRASLRTCLQRGLEQFGVLTEVLGSADASTLRDSAEAVATLPDVALCEARANIATMAVPAHLRARIDDLRDDLATAPMLVRLHRYRRANELTTRVLHEAEQLGYDPLLAEALYRRGDALAASGQHVDATTHYERAFHAAQTGRSDRLAAEIAVDLQLTYGYRLARPKLAERWTKLARAAVERLGDDAGALRAEFIRAEGLTALRSSDFATARERFEQTLAVYEALEGADPVAYAEASSNLGIACLDLGLIEPAEAAFERARTLLEGVVGPYNKRLTSVINNLGSLAQARGDHTAAHDHFKRVYEAELALFGPVDVRVAMSANNMGTALSALHRDAEAVELYQRSIRAYESGDHHGIDLARPVGNLAVSNMRAKDYEKAEANLLRAIQLIEADSGPMQVELSGHWFNLGSVRLEVGEHDRALEAMQRSLAIDENAVGRDHPNVAQTLASIATVYLRTNRPEKARPLLEEALIIFSHFQVDPVTVGYTKFELARLLWEMKERTEARKLIEELEPTFVAAGEAGKRELERLREWKKLVSYR
jgi:tetratricopeptide (TPR) repeat protein/tRNA A-37 threonylcarbamoyl transferase component Bud32